MSRNDMVTVGGLEFVLEADKAILVKDASEVEIWLPKSQIEWPEGADRDDILDVDMPEWLAMEKGLI